MKVGKEQIVGLLAAIDAYLERDHQADLDGWAARVARIEERLHRLLPNLVTRSEGGGTNPDIYVPQLRLELGSRSEAARVHRQLIERDPAVYCHEGALWAGSLILVPSCLRDSEEGLVVDALIEAIESN